MQGEKKRRSGLAKDPSKLRFGNRLALNGRLIRGKCGRTLKRYVKAQEELTDWRCRQRALVKKTDPGVRQRQHFHGLVAAQAGVRHDADLLQHQLGMLARDRVIVDDQNAQVLGPHLRVILRPFVRGPQRDRHSKGGTDALLALHSDVAVHHFHDVLGDGHGSLRLVEPEITSEAQNDTKTMEENNRLERTLEEEDKAKREAEEKARREAEEKARHEAEEKAKREAEEKARHEAEEKARHEAEEKAKREAEEKAKRDADEKAKREAEEKARREADEKAKREAEEKAKREAEEKARHEADEKAKREAEEKARREADEKAKREAEEKAKREAEEKAKREADEKAKREAETKKMGGKYHWIGEIIPDGADQAEYEKELEEMSDEEAEATIEALRKLKDLQSQLSEIGDMIDQAQKEEEEKTEREKREAQERAKQEAEENTRREQARREREEAERRTAEARKKAERDRINEEIFDLTSEMNSLRGLFAGIKRKKLQKRIDELNEQLHRL